MKQRPDSKMLRITPAGKEAAELAADISGEKLHRLAERVMQEELLRQRQRKTHSHQLEEQAA